MARRKSSTKVEILSRVIKVKELIVEGYSTNDIVTELTTTYKVDARSVYRYLKVAILELWDKAQDNIEEKRKIHIQKRMDLYLEALENKENRLALDILDSIAKLESLFVHNVDLTSKGKSITPQHNLKNLTEEELRKLDELTSKLGN